jgi:phosphoglycerate dehydrogenase-like enzyme
MRYKTLYLCPLGQRHQKWRIRAAPKEFEVVMIRSTETTKREIMEHIHNVDVLITERAGVIDRDIIGAGANLKVIVRYGSLSHDIDFDAARERNIRVIAEPIIGAIAVAENLMLQILAVLRRAMPLQKVIHTPPDKFKAPQRTTEDVFSFNWSRQKEIAGLQDKTVGILGFGEIGVELTRRLIGWGCRVLYSKRNPYPTQVENELRISHRDSEQLLCESDILVCLLPYFKETDMWLNRERISMMKRSAYLCHAGSGSVIDEQAVADAVRSGHLAGVSFDTFEWEPIKPSNPLFILSNEGANVFLLPHIGACGDSTNSFENTVYARVWQSLQESRLH